MNRDAGSFCEGKTFEIGMAEGISCYHSKSSGRFCPVTIEAIIEDKSDDIQITGASSISKRAWYTNPSTGVNAMAYTFKAERSTEIIITSRSLIEIVIPDGCKTPEITYIAERTYHYKVTVIPKPSTPSLTVERYISPGSVNFIASGCPTEQDGYDYQWNEVICQKTPNENFFTGSKDGKRIGAGGASYRVLCSALNGTCLSEPSGFEMGLSYSPPDMSQIPQPYVEQIKKIENIRNTGRLDYHHYSIETPICDLSRDPNCTIQNVFRIILSGNQFIAALTADMRDIGFGTVRKSFDNFLPVKSYGIVNLSDPLIRFALETPYEILHNFAKNSLNPIMTYIDNSNNSILNYTLPDHVLSPGRVIRQVIQKCNKIYIVTIGEGNTKWGDTVTLIQCPICLAVGISIAAINTSEGKTLFQKVDARVKNEYERKYP